MTMEIIKTEHSAKGEKRRKVRGWVQRLTLAMTVLTPLYFIVAALGTKFGLFSMRFGFGKLTYSWSKHVLMALLAAGLISLLFAIFIKPRKGFGVAVPAIVLAVLSMGYGASIGKKAEGLPFIHDITTCLLYTSPSPRDQRGSRMPSSA